MSLRFPPKCPADTRPLSRYAQSILDELNELWPELAWIANTNESNVTEFWSAGHGRSKVSIEYDGGGAWTVGMFCYSNSGETLEEAVRSFMGDRKQRNVGHVSG